MMSKIRNLFNKIKSKIKKSEVDDDDEFVEINAADGDYDEVEIEDQENSESNEVEEEFFEDVDDNIEQSDEDYLNASEELHAQVDDNLDEDKTGDIPVMSDPDKTGDVPIASDPDKTGDVPIQIQPEDTTEEVVAQEADESAQGPVMTMSEEDSTGEFVMEQEDLTGEIPLQMQAPESSEQDHGDDEEDDEYDETHSESEDHEDFTSSEIDDAIDLDNSQLAFKDRAQMLFQKVKDKLNRFNRKKFQQLTVDNSKDIDDDKAIIGKNRKKLNDVLEILKARLGKVDYKNIHREFFHEGNQNLIHKTFQFAMVLTTVFLVGKYTALLLKGADKDGGISSAPIKVDESRVLVKSDLDGIKNAKVFKTDAVKPKTTNNKPINTVTKCEKATRKTSLPIKLVNTIVLQDSVKSIASVQVRSAKDATNIREGDKIQGMATLGKIDRMKIIIKNLSSGTCEYVEADKKKSRRRSSPIAVMSPKQSRAFNKKKENIDGIENEGNDFTIEKTFLQEKLKDINSILTQARGIQLTNPDGSMSFKIVEIQPGSVFSYLGIENNDVITEIGGKKISDLNQVMSLFGSLQNMDKLNLKVKRGGQEVPLNYKFR